MDALRLLLLPFSWVYALALRIRHGAYDAGLLKSTTPSVPTIVIGNMALGGTGKTPHVELALRTLMDDAPLATLSRGYGRSGTTLREVHRQDDAADVGDEPLMMKRKFSGVRVFVGADRVAGVEAIQALVPGVKAVVLDDAFQHRRLKAGLNIVLTTWQHPWNKDHLLPAGHLRDLPRRARSADAVVVTKCPLLPTVEEQHRWRMKLGLGNEVQLFFSGLKHGPPRSIHDPTASVPTGAGTAALLFTGIAQPGPLVTHAKTLFPTLQHVSFPDHHRFSTADQARLARLFGTFATNPKTLLTTEKDLARLGSALLAGPLEDLPLAVIEVRAEILNEPTAFTALLRSHVATHQAHR